MFISKEDEEKGVENEFLSLVSSPTTALFNNVDDDSTRYL